MSLNAIYRELGAQWTTFADHRLPLFFETGIQTEHRACRESAALFDVSHMGLLFVFGENATTALERLLPSDLKNMRLEAQKYTVLTLPNGGVLDDLVITRLRSGWLLVVNSACLLKDFAHLKQFLPSNISVEMWRDQSLFALQGPKSVEILQRFGVTCRNWPKFTARFCSVLNSPMLISRSGYTGEDGFEILMSNFYAENFVEACLMNPEVTMAGLAARDSLRLEAGLCLYGQELTESITPIEANLSWVIDKSRRFMLDDSRDFLGAETILAQLNPKHEITQRRRIGLTWQEKRPLRTGLPLFNDMGDEIGVITSGGYSPKKQQGIALGLIDLNKTTLISPIFCDYRQRRYPLTVSALPFD
jgi:aminomethyltransferase